MTLKKLLLLVMVFLFVTAVNAAETVEGLPLHISKPVPGVVRLWAGDHISSTAVTAIATSKGIVVIDTTDLPVLDKAFRKIIARELGRNDFKFLINTHGHADHTNGNGVYADCDIIAHETVPEMMRENLSDIARLVQWYSDDIKRLQEQITTGNLNQNQLASTEERLIIDKLTLQHLQSSPQPAFPKVTFGEKLTMECGDTTLELYYAGGTHTKSDIFIHVPEKGLLFTGDIMADKWLTDTPGCLATFAVRSGDKKGYQVLLKNWQHLLEQKEQIKHYIPGHWNGELSYEGFKARFDYTRAMLEGVLELAARNGEIDELLTQYSLQGKFPHLVNSPGFSLRGHMMTINHLYQLYSGRISVATALQELFQENSFPAKFPALRDDILKNRAKYFCSEAEINATGYFLLQQVKEVEGAIQIFELNRDLFPQSWNACDSLAEAWYNKGEKKKALELYRKSLELNPGNQNGRQFVERIEQELQDRQ